MKHLIFTLSVTTTPWKVGQAKTPFSTIRMAMQCTKVEWFENSETTEASFDTKIFAYLKVNGSYIFNHVCSPTDLLEIGTDGTDTWCRKDYIDIIFPSIELAIEARGKLESDIQYLSNEIENYVTVSQSEIIEVT